MGRMLELVELELQILVILSKNIMFKEIKAFKISWLETINGVKRKKIIYKNNLAKRI
jgi:hypothetical protein